MTAGSVRLGRIGTNARTGRDSALIVTFAWEAEIIRMADVVTHPPDAERVEAFGADVQSLHERGVTWVSFKPMANFQCHIDFALRKFRNLGLLSGMVQGVRHEHVGRDSGDGDDDLSFHLNVSGVSRVDAARRETTLHDGDGMLLSYAVSRTISREAPVDHRVIRLPRSALGPLVPNIDATVLLRIPSGTGMLSLLKGYVDAAFHDPALAVPDMRAVMVAHLCDLVAVTLGATRDAAAVAEGRGIRAARLRAIKVDIEENLVDGDLSPSAVAKRQRVSDSYVRKLFPSEGTSFSQYVLSRKLMRAHRMLSDWRRAQFGIAAIAYDAGFGDLSYFNRVFKRCYGSTPSEVREAINSGDEPRDRP
jgi:AraC-like DNA-binding protein